MTSYRSPLIPVMTALAPRHCQRRCQSPQTGNTIRPPISDDAVPSPQDALEITGTFKQCKGNLVKEGFDPNVIKDPLFFRDDKKKSYVPLNPDIYAAILDMKLNL